MKFKRNKIAGLRLLFILWVSIFSLAESTIEELEKKLQTVKGKDKAKVLNDLSKTYLYSSSPDKVLEYANKARKLAQKFNDREEEAKALSQIALGYQIMGKYDTAFEYYHKALEIFEELNDSTTMSRVLDNMGMIQRRLGHDEAALEYCQRALNLAEKTGNKRDIARFSQAIWSIYQRLGKYDLALESRTKALSYAEEAGDQRLLASINTDLGLDHAKERDFAKALVFFKKALKFNREINNKDGEITNLLNLSIIYMDLDEYEKSGQYSEEGLALAKKMDNKRNIYNFYNHLAALFERKGDYKKALEYASLCFEAKDEYMNEEKSLTIATLQVKYETAEKEKEISRQKNIRNFFLSFSFLTLVFSVIVFDQYRVKRRALKQLKIAKTQIEKENETKDKLFSIIAHDLSSSLNGLVLSSSFLRENYPDLASKKILELIGKISQHTKNIAEFLKNLLQWSVSQSKEIKTNPQRFDIASTVDAIIDLYKSSAENKGIHMESEVEKGTFVHADKDMIRTCIGNLVSNAIKFTDRQGSIKVCSKQKDNRIQIEVSDTGIGMDEEKQAKLFKRGVHGVTKGTSGERGLGLGLILCKEFVEKNGGQIRVKSQKGEGSTFYFSLPKG